MTFKRIVTTILAVAGVAMIAGACGTAEKPAQTRDGLKAVVELVRAIEVPETHLFSGSIQGEKRATVSTKIMGQVLAVYVDAGDRVTEGQPLLKIKSDDLDAKKSQVRANMAEAQAALKNVEVNYNRMKELFAAKSATQKELDDVEAAYTMAKARVKAIEEMEKEVDDALGYADVLSPFAGSVVQKMTEVGNTAAPGLPLLIVEDMRTMKITLNVPETEIHLFGKNQTVEVSIDAAGITTTASITQVSPSGQPGSRQYEVQAVLKTISPLERERIRSGMFARATLRNGTRKMIVVPDSLIIQRGQLEGLYTAISGDQAVLRWIRTGRTFDGRKEVLSGLADGEKIIVSAEGPLRDGMKIEVAP